MLFQVYGENALFQWGGLIAVLLVLMLLNWYSIKSKRGALIMLVAIPAIVTVYCVAVAVGAGAGAEWALQNPTNLYMNGWFHYAKLYAALLSCISFLLIRFQWGIGKKKWFIYTVPGILILNILIAVISDFEHAIGAWYTWELSSEGVWLYGGWHNVMNALAGILCIVGLTAVMHIYVSKSLGKDGGRDVIWADMTWIWIIPYDLWNFAYTYNNLPTHSWYCGVALLLAPTILAFVWNRGSWLINRGHTLTFWCMFAQVFPLFMEQAPFSVRPAMYADGIMTNGAVNTLPMTVVSALALVANIALVCAAVYRSRKLKKNWWKNEMFANTKDYREALERAEFHVGYENGLPVTEAEREAANS